MSISSESFRDVSPSSTFRNVVVIPASLYVTALCVTVGGLFESSLLLLLMGTLNITFSLSTILLLGILTSFRREARCDEFCSTLF